MEVEARPLRARKRPFVFMPFDKSFAGMANLQQHLRLFAPAGILALEEMAEEFLLQLHAVIRVKVRPVLDAMTFEPLLGGGGANETFEIAARMQALAAPVGGRKERRLDLAPIGHAGAPVFVGVELA